MISNVITKGINGIPKIPGDKSISHRSIIIPSVSNGICEINNILKSDDVLHTLNALKSMGVNIEENNDKIIIQGKGLNSMAIMTWYVGVGKIDFRASSSIFPMRTFPLSAPKNGPPKMTYFRPSRAPARPDERPRGIQWLRPLRAHAPCSSGTRNRCGGESTESPKAAFGAQKTAQHERL